MEYRTTRGLRGRRLAVQVDDLSKSKTYGGGRVCAVSGCETGCPRTSLHHLRPAQRGLEGRAQAALSQAASARRDDPVMQLRAVRPRVRHEQPRREVLQRRLPHEGLPGPGRGDPSGEYRRVACLQGELRDSRLELVADEARDSRLR